MKPLERAAEEAVEKWRAATIKAVSDNLEALRAHLPEAAAGPEPVESHSEPTEEELIQFQIDMAWAFA